MQVLNGVGDGENFNLCLNYIFKRPLISRNIASTIFHTQKKKRALFWYNKHYLHFHERKQHSVKIPGGHLAANISFRAHFLHIFVLISLFLAEAKGGWKPIGSDCFSHLGT